MEEPEGPIKVPSEEVSGVEEEGTEAYDPLALDLLVGVRACEALHRRVVNGRELRPDGWRDGRDIREGAEDANEVGSCDEAFCCDLVELVADGCDEEGYDLDEFVDEGLGVVGAEEETEEGQDLDLERRRCSRKTAV